MRPPSRDPLGTRAARGRSRGRSLGSSRADSAPVPSSHTRRWVTSYAAGPSEAVIATDIANEAAVTSATTTVSGPVTGTDRRRAARATTTTSSGHTR